MADSLFGGNLSELLRKAQDLGQQLKARQDELAGLRIPVSVGGGMVQMVFNGKGEALSLQLDPAVVDAKDIAMLQDLVLSAVNEGVRQAQQRQQDVMSKMAGGLKIPGLTG
jgi:DNA-binding YbaB/EbfC family protein